MQRKIIIEIKSNYLKTKYMENNERNNCQKEMKQ